MTKPSNFIKNSDYKSVGNDDNATLTLSIPASFTVPANGETTFQADVVVGRRNAPTIIQMMNSRQPSFYSPVRCLSLKADSYSWAGIGTFPDFWTAAYIFRLNPTTIRMQVVFSNVDGPGVPMNITGAAQTITAKIKTFLDPFAN